MTKSQVWRFFLVVPSTFALVGAISSPIALLWWFAFGRPDFYFRSWEGMFFVMPVVGALTFGAGCLVAAIAFVILSKRRRVVRLGAYVAWSVLSGGAILAVVHAVEIGTETVIGTLFLGDLIAIVSMTALLFVCTRPNQHGLCPRCAYDLRGNMKDGCPECGWGRDSQ